MSDDAGGVLTLSSLLWTVWLALSLLIVAVAAGFKSVGANKYLFESLALVSLFSVPLAAESVIRGKSDVLSQWWHRAITGATVIAGTTVATVLVSAATSNNVLLVAVFGFILAAAYAYSAMPPGTINQHMERILATVRGGDEL